MGLFDEIYVDNKVLHDHQIQCSACGIQRQDFQTKSLDSALERYYLHYTDIGQIKLHFMDCKDQMMDIDEDNGFTIKEIEPEWPHQWLVFYASCECGQWNEWKVKFTDGVAQQIKRVAIESITMTSGGFGKDIL